MVLHEGITTSVKMNNQWERKDVCLTLPTATSMKATGPPEMLLRPSTAPPCSNLTSACGVRSARRTVPSLATRSVPTMKRSRAVEDAPAFSEGARRAGAGETAAAEAATIGEVTCAEAIACGAIFLYELDFAHVYIG
jgi:hypothetical protein